MRRAAILTIATLISAIAPTTAMASYYLTKPRAEHYMRIAVHNRGYAHAAAYCRPQGTSHARSGYVYHRWVCGWIAGNFDTIDCRGRALITGSSNPGQYYLRNDISSGDCEEG